MRVVFVGDVVGRPGRDALKYHLPIIRREFSVDLAIVNGENFAHGFGMTASSLQEVAAAGVDCFTGGNHSWDKKEIVALFDSHPIIRPLNFPAGVPGKGTVILESGDDRLAVVNLLGHFSMGMVENPFNTVKAEVERLRNEGIRNIFIDFHAETTSEKNALLHMLAGQVGMIVGTHTHVGTDDLLIHQGTGYVTDVGLTGCFDGVIGVEKDAPIYRFTTGMKKNFDIPRKCHTIFQAVIADLEDGVCRNAFKIKAYGKANAQTSMEAYRL